MMRDDSDRTPAWRRYLRFWRNDATRDVNEELAFHLESTVEELVASGMSREVAREIARRKFGDVDGISQTLYTLSHQRERRMAFTDWLDAIRNDLTFGIRQLRKSPAFTIVAVLTLALGIGANSAIFSVVYSVLLQPLPYANGDRILALAQRDGQDAKYWMPFGNYSVWQREATAFESIGAWWGPMNATLTGSGDPAPVSITRASAGYWKTTFIPPVLGRYYTEAEDRPDAAPVAVISQAMWAGRFAGDSAILGRTVTLDSRAYTVIGVAAQEYLLSPPAEMLWVPLAPSAQRTADFSDHELRINGLLKPGVPASVAMKQLTQIETRLAAEHPHSGYDGGTESKPLGEYVVGGHRTRLYTLLGAVVLVLLIACGNIANLLLARATVRRGEIAIRGALGATRGRIVTQLLAESVLLAVAGGALGLVVAYVGTRFLISAPAQIPRLQDASLNAPVLVFTLALSMMCAIVFGLIPALRAARLDLQQTLRDGGRESRTVARERLRWGLVVGEICVAELLLIGAGLLIRSGLAVQAVPAGFDTRNLLALSIGLPRARYADNARIDATFQGIERAIAAIPGVKSVGRSQVAPIYGFGWNWTAKREGSDGHDDGATIANMRGITPTYFSTLAVPVLRGRAFTAADAADAPKVAIVSRGLAKRLYGDVDPVGRRISNGGDQWKEIVGVVDDMRASGLKQDAPPEMYVPSTQWINGGQTILVRGNVPVLTLVSQIRRAVGAIDPLIPLTNVSTMEQAVANQAAMDRFSTWLLALLGGTGLILAIVGVYGVVGYVVAQRSHEFGVRMALGASASEVGWLVVRQGLVLASGGVTIGLALALGLTRVLQTMLFGITPHDPLTFVSVAVLLALVAVAASYVPARRATRVDPLRALRSS
ncbi:MAG TPA: ABC transporter permease [Gemmatimonadaceae bacterium]